MICLLKGTIHSISDVSLCILNSSGVGYEVFCNKKTLSKVKEGYNFDMLIHTQVSQEDVRLYGFLEDRELNFFKMLIKVNGVGCKMAQSILDLDVNTLSSAIIDNDVRCLTKIKGVGAKTAQRIILELKSIVESKYDLDSSSSNENENVTDAKYALIALGYNSQKIDTILKDIEQDLSSSDIIKEFLKIINK